MQGESEIFDIAVIGGGISGLGAAAHAAKSGFSVVLLEKGQIAAATSNSSLRIMHGGLRYLQQLDFVRVLRSARAQQELLREYPNLMRPLRCLMPLKGSGLKSQMPMRLAGAIYGSMTQSSSALLPKPRVLSEVSITSELPELKSLCPYGVFEWHDVSLLDPPKLHALLAKCITDRGGKILQHSPVTKVQKETSGFGVHAQSGLYRSKVVIDARGPWIDQAIGEISRPSTQTWCKAFNVVLSRQLLNGAAFGIETSERRLFFLVPRNSGSALGTAYFPFCGDPATVSASTEEMQLFIASWNSVAPSLAISMDDIQSIEVGVLPTQPGNMDLRLVGQERIVDKAGYIHILSTKYTTFQVQAERALNLASPYLRP